MNPFQINEFSFLSVKSIKGLNHEFEVDYSSTYSKSARQALSFGGEGGRGAEKAYLSVKSPV